MRDHVGRVTIYTVAERAGVSISTVSLAVNAPHRVSDATRARVFAAAGALGYRAGGSAPIARGHTRIAVAAPFTSYGSYLRRYAGMLQRARDTAVDVTAHDLDSAASSRHPLLEALPSRDGVDGLIVMGVPLGAAALRASRRSDLPVVLVDVRPTDGMRDDVSLVLVDDEKGGHLMGAHLAARGHRRAVFVHEPQLSGDYVSAGMLRVRGLEEHIRLIDFPVTPTTEIGPKLLRALRGSQAPTAVVANHDELAARVWSCLVGAGVDVPGDVAVVGYDDGPLAEGLGLTTVRQPFEETGATALGLVLDAAAGDAASVRRIELTPVLVERSTS
jgi:DNA-binding LacI/PurR family transcriptional regulator